MLTFLTPVQGGVRLRIQVQPGASKSEVAGLHGDRLKIRIHAPPADGEANEELIAFFSQLFGVGKSWVNIVTGATGRSKTVEVLGVEVEAVRSILLKAIS